MTPSIYPPDYTSAVGQVRVLTTDTVLLTDPHKPLAEPEYLHSDAQLLAFLVLNGNKVKAAAADVIDTLATNEALISKKIRTEDLQTDGPAVANSLRLQATGLRAAQRREDEEAEMLDSFQVVDFTSYPAPWPIR